MHKSIFKKTFLIIERSFFVEIAQKKFLKILFKITNFLSFLSKMPNFTNIKIKNMLINTYVIHMTDNINSMR